MYATSYVILLPTILIFGHVNGSIEHQIKLFFFGLNNDHLWFLKALFFIFIIFIMPTYVVKFNNKHYYFMIFILALILFALKPSHFSAALKYIPFFALGYISRKHEFVCEKLNSLSGFILMVFLHFIVFLSTELNFFIAPNKALFYATALFGIYSMYYLVNILTPFFIYWNLFPFIKSIESRSYSIYLFHVTFIYFILFLFSKYDFKAPTARIFLSFLVGLLAPIFLHNLFSKICFISHLFSIPYRKR
jgi:peptidoglycan/LPS O-acetylase OafA/YrhL